MNDHRTLKVDLDFMSNMLTDQAHMYENIEEYQRLKLINFEYDDQTQELIFYCDLIEETLQ